jgi:hypothetical protein
MALRIYVIAIWPYTVLRSKRISKHFLQEKAVEATKQKEERRKKPKPEEQEGTPPRQHCPPEKRRGDSKRISILYIRMDFDAQNASALKV